MQQGWDATVYGELQNREFGGGFLARSSIPRKHRMCQMIKFQSILVANSGGKHSDFLSNVRK